MAYTSINDPSAQFQTALYTGRELDYFEDNFLNYLNYIKVGRYIEKLGGLKSPETNQRIIKLR